MSKDTGLEGRYIVERVDGKPVGGCIVLEFKDTNSWDAIELWAETVDNNGYHQLAADVRYELTNAKLEWMEKVVQKLKEDEE